MRSKGRASVPAVGALVRMVILVWDGPRVARVVYECEKIPRMSTPTNAGTSAERYDWGRSLRDRVPQDSHTELGENPSRDPVGWITQQEANRLQFVIAVRQERIGDLWPSGRG